MSLPVGTILTVPKSYSHQDWIDYKDRTLNSYLYPELVSVLGTTELKSVKDTSGIPVGTLIYSFAEIQDPDYLEWGNNPIDLNSYPELVKVIENMIQEMDYTNSRELWIKALEQNTLPDFGSVFIKGNVRAGEYQEAQIKSQGFKIVPAVLEKSNTLSAIGLSRNKDALETYSIVDNPNIHQAPSDISTIVLLAKKTSEVDLSEQALMVSVPLGTQGKETVPNNISMRVYIKARNTIQNLPETHKLIIKIR